MKIFLIFFLSIMILPIFAPSHPEYVGVDSPRIQITQGVLPEEVICKEGRVLIIKHNGSPACVRPDTAVILEDRGWGVMPPPCCKPTDSSITNFEECIAAGNPAMESYPRQCRTPDGKHFVEEINDNPVESSSCSGSAGCFTDYVTRIVDGDTIHTATLKIRLSLTNTPETYQDGFIEAADFTKSLCPVGSRIIVDQDDLQRVDQYGRVLAKVFCGDKILNSELLYNGHANILKQYCSTSEFSGESWAKRHGCSYEEEPPKYEVPKSESSATKQSCDSSYPDVCIPPYPPDLDCGEITYSNFRVIGSDPHGFDGDNDGIGCES